jgi:hypothetical protein
MMGDGCRAADFACKLDGVPLGERLQRCLTGFQHRLNWQLLQRLNWINTLTG